MSATETTPDIVDGTAVEVYQPPPPPTSLFRTDDPVEVVAKATAVADALKDVIKQRNLYAKIQGREHVKVEGWQLLGSMLGVTAVCVATEQVANGWKATVEARAGDGRVVGRADAVCTKDENQWKSRDDYARLSMAQTRATSKALKGPLGFVVSLAGYATTPAEEMSHDAGPQPVEEPARESLPDDRVREVIAAIKRAKMPLDWARMQLVAVGAPEVPDGPILTATLQALTPEQATELIGICDEAANR